MWDIVGFFQDILNTVLNFFSLVSHYVLEFIINIVVYTMILLIIGLCGGQKTFDFVLRFLEGIAGFFKAIFASPSLQQFVTWIFNTIWNIILGAFKLIVLMLEKINWQFIFDKIEDFFYFLLDGLKNFFLWIKERFQSR